MSSSPANTTADTYVAALAEALKLRGLSLGGLGKRYGKEFKDHLEAATPEEQLYRAIERIADRWPDYKLSVSQARSDVQRGKPASVGSPTERERVADYEHLFALNERQKHIMRRVEQVGLENALVEMRSALGGPVDDLSVAEANIAAVWAKDNADA